MRRAPASALIAILGTSLLACQSSPPERSARSAPANQQWRLGADYIELSQTLAAPPPAGKVNVTIYFVTTAPYWPKLRPEYEKWLKTKPEYIDAKLSPAIVFPNARSQARAFLTLREMGRDDLFYPLFDWIWEKDHYPVYHTVMHPDDAGMAKLSLEFAKANGLDGEKFSSVYSSTAMDEKVALQEIETHFAAAATAVINGKLATDGARLTRENPRELGSAANSQKMFKLVEDLSARQLMAGK